MTCAVRKGPGRALLAVPALGVALILSACGSNSGTETSTTPSTTAPATSSGAMGMSSAGSMPGMSDGQSMPSAIDYPPVTPGPAAAGAHNAADVAFASGDDHPPRAGRGDE